jgi:hypothetical protein
MSGADGARKRSVAWTIDRPTNTPDPSDRRDVERRTLVAAT